MAIRDHVSQGYGAKARAKIMTVDTAKRRVEAGLKDGSMAQIAIWDDAGHAFRWPKEGEIWIIRRDAGVWRLDSRVQSGQIDQGGLSAQPEPAPIATRDPGDMRLDSSAIYDADGKRLATTDGLAYQTVAVNDIPQPHQPTLDLKAGSGVTLTATNDSANARTEITVANAGLAYQTVAVNDTAQPERATLDLTAGSGITLTATDDPGDSRTQVTVAVPITTAYNRVTVDAVSTASMANVPRLSFVVGAPEVWSFEMYIFLTGSVSGSNTLTFQFTGPAAATVAIGGSIGNQATVVSTFSSPIALTASLSAGVQTVARMVGTIVTSSNAGPVQLQQSNVSSTQTVKVGSFLLATKGS